VTAPIAGTSSVPAERNKTGFPPSISKPINLDDIAPPTNSITGAKPSSSQAASVSNNPLAADKISDSGIRPILEPTRVDNGGVKASIIERVDSRENRNVRNYDLVGFSEGSTELSNDFKDLVTTLSERKVVITGYADKEEADPIAVSLNRAQVVKDYLIGKGWNEANITIKANGATDQFDKKNLAPNRRVYIQGDWPLD
jgi:hypothetical protein